MDSSAPRRRRKHENTVLEVGGETIAPGERQRFEIRVARLPTGTWLHLPLEVVNGEHAGPRLWLTAAVHGDELNGAEIIRRVLAQIDHTKLAGALVAVPIVNVFGFVQQLRYLPDRRDLNRSFPGAKHGSLAARLARLIMVEVVGHSTHGIDLHTGSHHRTNLPQIRADLSDPETRAIALAFGTPVVIDAHTRDGSLRHAARQANKPVLLYEGGEALRFDELAIQAGVDGVLRTMAYLGMIDDAPALVEPPILVARTRWLRARRGGIMRCSTALGARVGKGQTLAEITDAFGRGTAYVRAPKDGIVIGLNQNPLVNQGDAVLHLALADDDGEPSIDVA
ncbi:MAG: succinylglutamate desuccinylase/aspartoacylase family protein [Myxococcales bacterium]|nr:succinylglutamate desuccinylase/aspartoacylase family protein [Myxococcales bacterium]